MDRINRDQFYLKEFLAPILPLGMVLAAIYLAGLWAYDRLAGKPGDVALVIAQLGGAVMLVLLATACRRFAEKGWHNATAAVSLTYGGLFATCLSLRSWINDDGLLTVLPACMMVVFVTSIFAMRIPDLLAAYVMVMTPAVILTLRIDPSVSNESQHLASVLLFTALTAVPFYYFTGVIKERYYAALMEQRERATQDPLTSLLNRTAWFEQASAKLNGLVDASSVHAMLYLDVDHFKSINDHVGHAKGDEVLRQMANLLRASFPDGALISRYGGEEFVVLVEEREPDHAVTCAEHLRASLAIETSADRAVTVSVGVAFYLPGESLDHILHRADLALLRAKAMGRDRVEIAEHPFGPPRPFVAPVATPVATLPGRSPMRDRLRPPAKRVVNTHMVHPT